MAFTKNVFINCPFDNQYFPVLRAVLFTIVYLDYKPKISETSDSGKVRIQSIKKLIEESKYSIHDISRVELNSSGLPRFNMPLECGIDFGAQEFGSAPLNEKVFLILESVPFRYQKFMSDIAGNDIQYHKNETELVIKRVRDFLNGHIKNRLPFPAHIYAAFVEFLLDYKTTTAPKNKFNPDDINAIPFSDLIELMNEWLIGWRARVR